MIVLNSSLVDDYRKQLRTISEHLQSNSTMVYLSDEENTFCFDVLRMMEERGIISDAKIDNCNAYLVIGDYKTFEKYFETYISDLEKPKMNGGYMQSERLTKNCEELLRIILEHRNEQGVVDVDAINDIYDRSSASEQTLFRDRLRILQDKKMLSCFWADDKIYRLVLLENGISYFDSYEIQNIDQRTVKMQQKEYDLFISHASSDKISFVKELYDKILNLGVKVFYDADSISWGDNWKSKIIEGTEKSEFAIIVISNNYFGREWTERELNEFLNRQNATGQKIVLPLLYNVSLDEMKKHYPFLSEIQALDNSKYTIEGITILFAKELIKRLRENYVS